MSLFDVIKYQVSIPPTQEELDALPETIREEWYALKNWGHLNSVANMLQVMWNNAGCHDYVREDIQKLKRMLEEL